MVKSIEQAQKIQKARVASGKRGYAKAVRRFLNSKNSMLYNQYKKSLDVIWPAKVKEAA